MTLRKFLPLIPFLCISAVFAGDNERVAQNQSNAQSVSSDCGLPVPGTSSYNAPAQIATNQAWHVWGSGSFIYWQAIEEDLELGDVVNMQSLNSPKQVNGKDFNFKYKPGFKVDLGWSFNYDNWDLFAEYTWFHTGNMITSVSAPGMFNPITSTFSGPVLASKVQIEGFSPAFTPVENFVSRTWNVKLDFLDLMIARSCYVGTHLKFRPSFGPRASWARQKMNYFETSNYGSYFNPPNTEIVLGTTTSASNKIISWGYGLKGALEADWMIGSGFRMFGFGAMDLLYTHYSLSSKYSSNNNLSTLMRTSSHAETLGFIRPHTEIECGLAYGKYFNSCKGYVDLAASYNFQVFWNYNMFLLFTNSPLPADEFYLHGLKVALSLAF